MALVGMPGVGKTLVGRLLAERLALPFVDSDAQVERAAGMTVAGIFERDGEAAFRALERAVIDRLLHETPLVLATGGGAMVDDESRALLLAGATTIWLDAPLELLVTRLAGTRGRPLLAVGLAAKLASLKAVREPSYALAGIRVDASGPPDAVADDIAAALRAWPDRPPAAPAR